MADNGFVSLKEYLIERQRAMEKEMLVRLDALNAVFDLRLASISETARIYKETTDEANAIYKNTTSSHLLQMNEFREENRTLLIKFLTRELFAAYEKQQQEEHQRLEEKIDTLESYIDKLEGKASQKSLVFTQMFTIAAFLIALVSLIIKL